MLPIEKLRTINTAMHVVAFVELVLLAVAAPSSLLVAPEDAGETKSILLPDAPSTGEFVLGLAIATFIGVCLLLPALWIAAVFASQRKAHARKLGLMVLGVALLFAFAGWPPEAEESAESIIAAGIAFGCGLASIAGLFLVIYAKRIEHLNASVLYVAENVDLSRELDKDITFSSETRQLFMRLSLFAICIVIALGITFPLVEGRAPLGLHPHAVRLQQLFQLSANEPFEKLVHVQHESIGLTHPEVLRDAHALQDELGQL